MASLFAGTDRLTCSALGLKRREQLNDRALPIELARWVRGSRHSI